MSALEFFYRCRHFVLWAIGDLINYAVSKFGVTVPFATKGAPLDEVTCYKYRKLAETVPEPARVYQLIPRIQSYVFTMDDKETAAEILQKAEAEGWSLEKICEVREQFAPAIERSFITGE